MYRKTAVEGNNHFEFSHIAGADYNHGDPFSMHMAQNHYYITLPLFKKIKNAEERGNTEGVLSFLNRVKCMH